MRQSTLLSAVVILLALPPLAAAGSPAGLVADAVLATTVLADGCAYPPSTWAANPDAWPVDQLDVAKVTRDKAELLDLLNARGNGSDFGQLMRETIAAKLNVANGAPADIGPYITWADGLLAWGKVTGRKVQHIGDNATANEVRKVLADYNGQGCPTAAAVTGATATSKAFTETLQLGTVKAMYR